MLLSLLLLSLLLLLPLLLILPLLLLPCTKVWQTDQTLWHAKGEIAALTMSHVNHADILLRSKAFHLC